MLTEPEKLQSLEEWNATDVKFPREVAVHELVEMQAEKTPNHVAVVFDGRELTYGEMNRRANRVAYYLRGLGVGPEIIVGICMERSIEMLVGLLGILKSGGAYLPLDPQYPKERLAHMLTNSRVPVVMTQETLQDEIPESEVRHINIDRDWNEISKESHTNPVSTAKPSNLAYVIYTSGSTGIPKGVMIEHKSLVNYTMAACDNFKIEPDDRVLQFASLSFDTAAEEIFTCLTRGATLVLRTDEMLGSTKKFLESCSQLGITILDLPTAFWHQMVSDMSANNLKLPDPLRLVILGGEKALPDRVKAWQDHVDQGVALLNTYGPTEATIVATHYDLTGIPVKDVSQEIPIGKPIQNARAYILNKNLQPVPVGVGGELCIGGVGLARGYLGRAELTKEKFLDDPFKVGERIYKTGDYAAYLPDGNIRYLDRLDDQVKVRGFRIELGEIEAALTAHDDVRQVVVVARDFDAGDTRLVAYILTEDGRPFSPTELRRSLRERLPEYMVPQYFSELEVFPLTPAGKVDRKALAAAFKPGGVQEAGHIEPRNENEKLIAAIWQELLGLDSVSVHDNFFEIGGHSLLGMQVIARIERETGVRLSPREFIFQTLGQVAVILKEKLDNADVVESSNYQGIFSSLIRSVLRWK
jgi:amino acid adenylation domain-containing protein